MTSLPCAANSCLSSSWSKRVSMGVGGDHEAFILCSLRVWSASSILPYVVQMYVNRSYGFTLAHV